VSRLLFVSYHFPPIGGGGVQRVSKFVRYLPDFAVQPVVLTGPGESEYHWAPLDPTMVDEIPDVRVIRVPGPVPTSGHGRIGRLLGRPSASTRWWIDSIVHFPREQGFTVDAILGELIPYETAFGVQQLATQLDVPWIADLQDPWALDEMWLYLSGVHRLADRARMRSTLSSASAVVMNTPEAVARLRAAFPEFRERRVVAITNGFDSADFLQTPPCRGDGIFRIVHSGYLHTDLGLRHRRAGRVRRLLGGMPIPGVDFLTRSHFYLLQAVEAVLQGAPSLRGVVQVHLVGAVTEQDREVAAPYPFVRFHEYKPHAETISLLQTADLLFLPMQDLPFGVRAGLVPGKTYEYMASGVPILAAVPDGDARDMLLSVGTAIVCRPSSVNCLADALRQRIDAWRQGAPRPQPNPAVLARFERRQLTSELAALIEEVVNDAR